MALTACHDAARQGISAHLRAGGYRIRAVPGAHRLTLDYAAVALAGQLSAADLRALDHLRRDRHTAEYGDFATNKIRPDTVANAVIVATRVTDAVDDALGGAQAENAGPGRRDAAPDR